MTGPGYYDRSGRYRRAGSAGSTSRSESEGWWTYGAPRPANRLGISPELPEARTVGWNIAFITAEAIGCTVAHYAYGVEWGQIAHGFEVVGAVGVALIVRAARRPPGWVVRVGSRSRSGR